MNFMNHTNFHFSPTIIFEEEKIYLPLTLHFKNFFLNIIRINFVNILQLYIPLLTFLQYYQHELEINPAQSKEILHTHARALVIAMFILNNFHSCSDRSFT